MSVVERMETWKWRVDSVRELGETTLYVTPEEYRALVELNREIEDQRTLDTAHALMELGIDAPMSAPSFLTADVALAWGTEVIVDHLEARSQVHRIVARAYRSATVDALHDEILDGLPQPGEPTMNLLHPERLGLVEGIRSILGRR